MTGGDLVAEVLVRHGVETLFTLCGGHVSPILVAAKRRGVRVVDVRHEATAVFAADATARLTGRPGVAVVTAGPGATNTITAVKNAQLAQSPVVVLGGAPATLLAGRGALQDIDQLALFAPHVKWAARAAVRRRIAPCLAAALQCAMEGVPGPVFVELPVDLLYPEEVVRRLYDEMAPRRPGPGGTLARGWIAFHLRRLFAGGEPRSRDVSTVPPLPLPSPRQVARAARALTASRRPLLLVGSQATLAAAEVEAIAAAVAAIGVPTYLSGMARGLLGWGHDLQLRHRRSDALREADLVVLAGVPCDFRLGYGRTIAREATVVAVNRSLRDRQLNRTPEVSVAGDPGAFLQALAAELPRSAPDAWRDWKRRLAAREAEREVEIAGLEAEADEPVDPISLCKAVDVAAGPGAAFVGDGGDFVATASYLVAPRSPLSWLDPGVFGTLGVGAGFALGAALARPEAEIWILWGDGAAGFSITEWDTFVRHSIGLIAVVGNDAAWTQIAREQIEILGDPVATQLAASRYDRVAEAWGGRGIHVSRRSDVPAALERAKQWAAAGEPVLVDVALGRSELRRGSLSM